MDQDAQSETSENPNNLDPGFWDEQLVREYGPTPTLRTITQWFKSNQPKIALQTREELKSLRVQKEKEKHAALKLEIEEHEKQRNFWLEEGRKMEQARLELEVEILKKEILKREAQMPKPGSLVLDLGPVRLAELEQLSFVRGMQPLEYLEELINDAIRRAPR